MRNCICVILFLWSVFFQGLYAQKDPAIFVFQVNQGIAFLIQYNGESNIVKIPSIYQGMPVTAIAAYTGEDKQKHGAFEGLDIDSIIIPNTIIRIGTNTFYNCEKLKNIKLPSSIYILDESAFEGCISLQKINIPAGVSKISNRLFTGCQNLKEIVLPNKVNYIGSEAFLECGSLTKVVVPKNVTKIGFAAFADCNKLVELKIEALKPPATTIGFLDNTSPQLRIKVPQSHVAIYQSAPGWQEYATQIIGF